MTRESFTWSNADGKTALDIGLPAWTLQGACFSGGRSDYLEDFFAEETSDGQLTGQGIRAKRLCAVCPVRRECLEWAFEKDDPQYRTGTFGGLSGSERMLVANAIDPIAVGLKVLEDQITSGLITERVPRRKELAHEPVTGSNLTGG